MTELFLLTSISKIALNLHFLYIWAVPIYQYDRWPIFKSAGFSIAVIIKLMLDIIFLSNLAD